MSDLNKNTILNKTTDFLSSLEQSLIAGAMNWQQLIQLAGPRGQYYLLIFLSVPFLQPIPMMGLSSIFGLVIILVALGVMFNRSLSLPKKYAEKEIPAQLGLKICRAFYKVFLKVEKVLKTRYTHIFDYRWFQITTSVNVIISAILLALPLPFPASNTIPALPIFLIGLGFSEKDGVLAIAGNLISILSSIFFLILFVAPVIWGVQYLTQ
jgi:hypothetical protein